MSIATAAKRGLLAKTGQSGAPVEPSFAYDLDQARLVAGNDFPYMAVSDLIDAVTASTLSPDGNYFYIYSTTTDLIRQYKFKYPFAFGRLQNQSIAANVNSTAFWDYNNGISVNYNKISWAPDGANLYLFNENTNRYHVHRVPASMPWHANTLDISSSYLKSKYEVFSKANNFIGSLTSWDNNNFCWSSDGSKLFLFHRDLNARINVTQFYSFSTVAPFSLANIKFDGRFHYGIYNFAMGPSTPGAVLQNGGQQFYDNDRRFAQIGSTAVDVLAVHDMGDKDEPNTLAFTRHVHLDPLGQNDPSKISVYDAAPRAFWIQGGTDTSTGNIYIVGANSPATVLPSTTNGAIMAYTFNNGNICGATYQYSARLFGSNSGLNRSTHGGGINIPSRIWMNDYGNVCVILDTSSSIGTRFYMRVFDLSTRYDLRTADWRGGNTWPYGYIGAYDGTNTGETTPQGIAWGNNGYNLYISGSGTDHVYQFDCKYPYSFSNVIYKARFSISAQALNHQGLYFRPDGLGFYVCDTANDQIEQYTLSVAWDITTATFTQTLSITANDATPSGIHFKPDGTQMYFMGQTADRVYQRPLTSAWDISTAGTATSFLVSTQETSPTQVRLSSDGTRMYVIGTIGNDINYYSLGTAWTVTSASYNSVFGNATSLGSSLSDFTLSDDGKDFWTLATATLYAQRRTLDTAYSITTAKLANIVGNSWGISHTTSGVTQSPKNFWVKPDMTKMWLMSGGVGTTVTSATTAGIQEFNFNSPLDFGNYTHGNARPWGTLGTDGPTTSDIRNANTPTFIQWNNDGNVMIFAFLVSAVDLRMQRFTFSTPWDMSSMIGANARIRSALPGVSPHFTVFGTGTTGGATTGGRINPDGNIWVMYSGNTASINQWWRFDFTGGNVETMTFTGNTRTFGTAGKTQLAVNGLAGAHEGIFVTTNINNGTQVSNDGTVWVVHGSAGYLYKWTSTTAWDFNTANVSNSLQGVGLFSIPVGLDNNPQGMRVEGNGGNLYVLGTANNIIIHYRLTNAYEINSAIFVQTVTTLPQTGCADIAWQDDGSSYYLISPNQDNVMQRTGLTTNWDPSTFTGFANARVNAQDTGPASFDFGDNGSKMSMAGSTNDRMYLYSMSTPWDITTLSYTNQSSGVWTSFWGTTIGTVRWSNTGRYQFAISSTNDAIYQSLDDVNWRVDSAGVTMKTQRYLADTFFAADGSTAFTETEAFAVNEFNPRAMTFAKDGQRMYILGVNTLTLIQEQHIFQYNL